MQPVNIGAGKKNGPGIDNTVFGDIFLLAMSLVQPRCKTTTGGESIAAAPPHNSRSATTVTNDTCETTPNPVDCPVLPTGSEACWCKVLVSSGAGQWVSTAGPINAEPCPLPGDPPSGMRAGGRGWNIKGSARATAVSPNITGQALGSIAEQADPGNNLTGIRQHSGLTTGETVQQGQAAVITKDTPKTAPGYEIRELFNRWTARVHEQPGAMEQGPGKDNRFAQVSPAGKLSITEYTGTAGPARWDTASAASPATGRAEAHTVWDSNLSLQRAHEVPPITMDGGTQAAIKASGPEQPPAARLAAPPYLQLAEVIRSQVGRDLGGRTHVRLQLQPESLGEVVIRLVYKDGNLSTHFHAATEGARQAIESSLSQLREALAGHQLNLQHSTVSAGGEEGRWGQGWDQGRGFNRQTRPDNYQVETGAKPGTAPAADETGPAGTDGLNHFV